MNNTIKLPTRYRRFAKTALDLAGLSDRDMSYPLCALVAKKNRVLSIGYNSYKTHTIARDTPAQCKHAELDAILRCPDDDLRGADVIVARVKADGSAGLARPCSICERILRKCGIRWVYYTVNSDSRNIQLARKRL